MGSKTKIIVLHMKEIIYTIVFGILGVVLVLLLFYMFGPAKGEHAHHQASYHPGVYTSSIRLDGQTMDVQVVVDEDRINGVSLINLDETMETMYPLLQSSMESISRQVCESQSTDGISYTGENQYTAAILTDAINKALDQARVDPEE